MKAPPTATECISQYLKIRNYIEAQQKAFDERMKEYKDALEQIENHMAAVALNEVGPSGKWSLATPQGTAFRKLYTSVKVADREAWMDFIFDGRREGFVTNHVPKDAVAEYIESFNTQPPGLDIATIYRIQFNSPKGI
jgi:hypothetical protein